MKAMILAAGLGTRLWPLTDLRSKPAIPFRNRPLIHYSVDYLSSIGIREIMVNLHHQPESIRQALGDGSRLGVQISYSFEKEILGTSGALDRVRDWLIDGDFVVINGKIVTDIDLGAAIGTHQDRRAIATLVLRPNSTRERFSEVEIGAEGRITRFGGFPGSEGGDVPLMFTGIQILSPSIFDYVPRGRFSHSTTDVYPVAIERGEPVIAYVAAGYWFEMSTLDRYLAASITFMKKDGRAFYSGTGSDLASDALVEYSVLWDRVTVGREAVLRRVVVGDDVRIPDGFSAEDAVIVRRRDVQQVERGKVAGDNVIVPIRENS
ncbi:MAG TPA: NDP-sugar synthase [Blastocatellia bacterium]|nr:NDP-sugar synthase [Blastocatellia bacterium]